ncbi:MAG: hypothetical protein IJW53_01195 [Clostridia bacterium]|nr:hypothetical protein [Clostridia bacterium]
MKYDTKRITSRAFLIYSLVNVLAYAFAHVAYLFANEVIGELFEYVSYYLSKSLEFLAPPIIAAIAYLILKTSGRRRAILFTLAVASARVFYSLPYYYIIFIYNYGYDSVESILLSFLATVLVILVTMLGVLISICVYQLVERIICKRSGEDIREALARPIEKTSITDFLARSNLPVLVFALSRFAFSLTLELVDTVAYLIEYRGDYLPTEIITILVNYILLFVLLVVSYLIASLIRNKLIADNESEKTSEE